MLDPSRYAYLFLTDDAARRAAAAGFRPSDIESETDTFCHGECHTLTLAMQHRLGCAAWVFIGADDGIPLHSGVILPDGRLLDMRGARSAAEMAEVCETFWGDGSIQQDIPLHEIQALAGLEGVALEQATDELESARLTMTETLAVLVPELAAALATTPPPAPVPSRSTRRRRRA